jgi:ketosteroid isomerase-like protein
MRATPPPPLDELVARFRDAWRRRDLEALADLWDGGGDSCTTYVAEEIPGALVGVAAISDYWRSVFERFRDIEVFLRPLAVDVLDGVAWLLSLGAFRGVRLADGAQVHTDGVRVAMVLRLTPVGWKVVHYIEAPVRGPDGER